MPLLPSNAATPTITEFTLPDQSNKVFIVTGSNAGIGAELAEILYAHHAKVYIAARSKEKSFQTVAAIRERNPRAKGELVFLPLDLADLTSVRAAAQEFLTQERRLHVLWNNAGVMIPTQGSKTKQGYELQIGTNCTAITDPSADVRVIWLSSSAADRYAPIGGVVLENLDYAKDESEWYKYGTSKAGNIFYGSEMARKFGANGIISVSVDPGNLNTGLYQHMGKTMRTMAKLMALHKPIYGAYTELYAGFSKDITQQQNGILIQPWGKIGSSRKDIEASTQSRSAGGTGIAEAFWEWSEKQVAKYLGS